MASPHGRRDQSPPNSVVRDLGVARDHSIRPEVVDAPSVEGERRPALRYLGVRRFRRRVRVCADGPEPGVRIGAMAHKGSYLTRDAGCEGGTTYGPRRRFACG